MANTFTSNYNLIKSEVGGDNATWGNNLHTTLDLVDLNMAKMLEDQLVSGITSSAINLTAGSGTGIISTSANLKYFENIVVGDKVRVSGSDETANGTAAIPKIHTVTAKTSADSITVGTQFVDDTNTTITVAKVLEPIHINSGPIVCAPLTNLSAATRAAGGAGVPGADTTDALVANGDVTLGSDAGASGDTVKFTSRVATDVLPSADGSYDLGASDAEWQDLHIDGTANIDSLVADTADINGGTVDGITSLSVSATTISMTGYAIGTNGKANRHVSTSSPASGDGDNGDVWYEYS